MTNLNGGQQPPLIDPRTASNEVVEMSWFAPICSDDFEFLGVPDSSLKSSWQHTSKIALQAQKQGFDNIFVGFLITDIGQNRSVIYTSHGEVEGH